MNNERRQTMKKSENQYVIVRGNGSGVFAGYLKDHKGQEVTLTKVRKLWYWDGACAVEQLAVDGSSKPEDCKFTVVVDEIVIHDAVQTLKCTETAQKVIEGVEAWKK